MRTFFSRAFFSRACITTLVATGAGLIGFFIASAIPGVSGAVLASSTSHSHVGCYGTLPTGAGATASSTAGSAGPTVSTGTAGATRPTDTSTFIDVAGLVPSSPSASQLGSGTETGTLVDVVGQALSSPNGVNELGSGTGTLVNVAAPVSSSPSTSQTGTGTGTLVNVAAPVSPSGGFGLQ